MIYDLSHLTQTPAQDVIGPIQDDEALLLFGLVRCSRVRHILEIGCLNGYSARNFVKAVAWCGDGTVTSVDTGMMERVSPNHFTVMKDAGDLSLSDIPGPVELLFLDCHAYEPQKHVIDLVVEHKNTEKLFIVLHDTNTHPFKYVPEAYGLDGGGWVHQPVERVLANELQESYGFGAVHVHTSPLDHDTEMPFRHGVTICSKRVLLEV